ncbi:Carbon monoxide dehydrogenase subunit G [Nakamurella panacisegetis]|uniref:Carbon monoxide dehydrogenase subunit G n=1 Tax=Nakamurella panacisegetis TaxID=1090615 RepID=A0A1H0ME09_9ACTN|nr:SRPBCC family protein [Nakamurella panacisegetis]SDO78634.1 Carbon monoxide dehydrogenase subunit G [Nakamurella panacisegetis]
MELEHRFEVPVGIETAWTTLLDMEKVGPCFPGATLETVDGDSFTGSVKIKLGPIQLTYKGKARIVEKDPVAHRAKIEASGNAARSASTAAMLVTATATAVSPNRTAVDLVTTLSITGRPAQFGRGVMVEVGNKLIGQFADAVSTQLSGRTSGGAELVNEVNPDEVAAEVSAASEAASAAGSEPYRSIGAHRVPGVAPEPINLLQSAGAPIAKRLAPVLLGIIALLLLRRMARRRRAARAAATQD